MIWLWLIKLKSYIYHLAIFLSETQERQNICQWESNTRIRMFSIRLFQKKKKKIVPNSQKLIPVKMACICEIVKFHTLICLLCYRKIKINLYESVWRRITENLLGK